MTDLATSVAVAGLRAALPLVRAFQSTPSLSLFLRDIGYDIDLGDLDDALFQAIPGVDVILVEVPAALTSAALLASSDEPGEHVGAIIISLERITPALSDLAGFQPGSAFSSSPLSLPSFWTDLGASIPDYLIVRYLREYQSAIYRLCRLLGVIVDERRDPLPAPFQDAAGPRESFRLDHLASLFSDPLDHLRSTYGWIPGGPLEHAKLLSELVGLAHLLGLRPRSAPIAEEFQGDSMSSVVPAGHGELASLRQLEIELARVYGGAGMAELVVLAVPGTSGNTPDSPIDGILVTPSLFGEVGARVPIDHSDPSEADWFLTFDASANATGAIGLWASPNGFEPHVSSASGSFEVGIEGRFDPPLTIIGGTTGTRLIMRGLDIEFGLAVDGDVEITARVALAEHNGHAAELIVEAGEGDGFVSNLLGDLSLSVPIGIGVTWSSATGFGMEGSAGLEVRIPLGLSLGGPGARVELTELLLGGTVGSHDGGPVTARFVAAVTASGQLGPLVVSVDEIGIELDLAPNEQGAISPALGFKMPNGLGIGIDMDPITGGGYLEINRDAGTYKGLVSVEVMSIGITAVVIIETKRPDIDGWSMFFALFIELPQIQLGFGFSLNGVGGLAGINRTIDAEALGSAVRSGSLSSILFPEDPIVDAPIIISELEAIFPPANNSYVFGPVVKIGWGTPPIVEAELGIVIAFGPDGVIIAVLGSVTAILPRPELELIALRLDLAGVIDTGKGTISLDASLHDSHIIGFALAGDMALRANFSDSRSFLFSVGGFHPAFTPPAGFPELARMSLGISAGSVIEISFSCYFAITSNTVQFGAAFDLWAKVAGFEIAGGTSFDALIKFSPFELQTSISLYVSVKAVGVDLLGVFLSASLTGPSPWHVVGTAEFKVLGISKDIRVDEIIGARTPQPPAPTAPDLLALLVEELRRPDNWSVVSTATAGVVFAERSPVPDADADAVPPLLARPDSTIEVAQTVLPLGVALDKYANTSMGEHNHFGIAATGGLTAVGDATEWFAPAQFFDILPRERLSRPSFEQFEAGVVFGTDTVEAGDGVDLLGGHDEFRIDPEFDPEPTTTRAPRDLLLPATELGVERVNAFRIEEAPRFDLLTSATFSSQRELV